MHEFTLHQLRCFDAVVTTGSFQAAADALNRTHPTVFSAIKALEQQVGIPLFDRSGYRVVLTTEGQSFHQRSKILLNEVAALKTHAEQLSTGEETALSVIIGDACPLTETLTLLNRFFEDCPNTRLDLHFETLTGPIERLLDEEADLIVHHIDKSDTRLEFLELGNVNFIPVAAPGFIKFELSDDIRPDQLRSYAQCVIRDTARHLNKKDYYIIEGTRRWTVANQLMKKEIILQGMGWGHLPEYLIKQELHNGRLVSIAGRHLHSGSTGLVAARLRDRPHGPIATKLWHYIEEALSGMPLFV